MGKRQIVCVISKDKFCNYSVEILRDIRDRRDDRNSRDVLF
jgi:hypothetical protein